MDRENTVEEAIDILQQLGLKEYEARCFVGLTRMSTGTAKRVAQTTDVPRTRVYDAVRVLEAQGLVEVQHTNPQRFRAVSMDEATETLRDRYDDRVDRLREALGTIESVDEGEETPVQEVWSITDRTAIENRSERLLVDVEDEVVLVVGDPTILTEDLLAALSDVDEGVDALVGTGDERARERVHDSVPRAQTFVSGLEWLEGSDENVTVGRLMLVDRSSILVSSVVSDGDEHAIFASGFGNGLIVIARRLLAQGLLPDRDPADVTD